MAEKARFEQPRSALMLTAFQMLGGGGVLCLLSLAVEQPWTLDLTAVPAQAWAAWAYLVVFGSCVGYASFSYLLSIDPPQQVGTYSYVNPIVAVLAGHWILGEEISSVVLLSTALIVASVAGLLSLKRG
jgi:drug/metabolite transporter (DMT)-like permease